MEWLSSYISQGVYTVSGPFHPFGGAVDIIVVQQPDGSFKSSPWYVRFGKFQGVLKTKVKVVNISVNGVEADFHMYLNHKGEAYFLKEVDAEGEDSLVLSTSSSDETEDQSRNGSIKKSKSCEFDDNEKNLVTEIDVGSTKIMARTNSRRSRIFGLMFGRKSMKEDSCRRDGDGMERISSLERAEIAADLLEVKWSTNLPTGRSRRDNASRLSSASNVQTNEAEKDVKGNDEKGPDSLLVPDDMDNSYGSGVRETECSEEITRITPCLRSQDTEISTLEACVLGETQKVIPETALEINEFDVGNAGFDKREKSSFSEKESGTFFIYRETSEILRVGVDGSGEQGLDIPNFSLGECEEAQVQTEFVCETMGLISEVNSQPECGAIETEKNLNDLRLLSDEDSCQFPNTEVICESERSSVSADTKNIIMESQSKFDMRLVTSDSVEDEILDVILQETIVESLTQDNCLVKEKIDLFENQSQVKEFSYSCTPDCSEVSLEEPSTAPGSYIQMVSGANTVLGLVEEAESHSICISSCPSNSLHLVQEPENLGEENKMDNLLPTKVTNPSIPSLESSEEDQFHFSDIDDFVPSRVQCKDSISSDFLVTENQPFIDDIEDMHGSNNMNHEPSSSSANAFEPQFEESMATSDPISIPAKGAVKEVERMAESLPNFRFHIDKSDGLHPLSHSLDSSSEYLKWGSLRKDVSSSSKSDSDIERQLVKEHSTVKDTRSLEELKNMSTNTAVEISLCRHLLHEGMGAEAASQAFDAEKVDLEKFVSLGPALVKNDKLVVRIGGCYFPWDAAAPIILGMVSFGCEQILEPEGKIAVERVEKIFEEDLSSAIVSSRGSWSLWPFISFKRSRTMNSVQPSSDGTKDSNAENASESTNDVTGDKNVRKIKVAKKKVKELVPTSEQLATLNLKEGGNVITFSFSTAMLGKQQVDARIYMWKWNTRIVVSDVDGTITKSDVLGQFMPLVGKDWSQTGVAHLFSAIKDNGYQLLFLSARAISQAYLTRQFLLNLKQDGKALPDGPVVISPDGLFPSLFREVIRRAPHEFKIACLKDIRELFPPDCNPFYAGFGNRDTDEISYLKVGIPKGKIFIINTKGEVAVNRRVDRKSYTSLHALVNGMFPAMSSAEQEEFNSWNYWRVPHPDIDI